MTSIGLESQETWGAWWGDGTGRRTLVILMDTNPVTWRMSLGESKQNTGKFN